MREWLARLRDWIRRDQLDRELTEELRFHARQLEEDARAGGASTLEASRTAKRRLGNATRVREEARDRWSWPWLDHFQRDLRYAIRGLGRSPAFTATVILAFGLGIGANAAMFGVIDRLMFRPFPYLREPDAVNRVYLEMTGRERLTISGGFEYTRYLDLKRWSRSFSSAAVFYEGRMAVGSGDATRERQVATVSASFFEFFNARPALGRFFTVAEDTTPRGAAVAVLSHEIWKVEFGGRDVIGETLRVRDVPCVIVGVAPPGFVGVSEGQPPAVFIPITTYAGSSARPNEEHRYYTRYNWGWVSMMVRRRPGVDEVAVSADLSQAYLRSWAAEQELGADLPPVTVANPRAIAGPLKTAAGPAAGLEPATVRWVTGVAVIVLLIACANVANLMFARVVRRRREIAVRLALGVSRRRLLLQGLTESVLLAGAGCVAGLAIAQWGGAALRHLFVSKGRFDVLTDWRTLAVATAFALLAGLVTGLGPALLAVRGDVAESLKAGPREGTYHRSRTRTALLVLQSGLSVILLVGAGLFVQSLGHVRAMRMGYDAERVLLAFPNLRGQRLSDAERRDLGERLLTAALGIPGVEQAATVSSVPFRSTSSTALFVTGIDSVRALGRFTFQVATPGYFATMGTRVIQGRPYTEADRRGTPLVAVVSESMARALWPGKDPLGKCLRIWADTMPCTSVIGVAEDAIQMSLTNDKRFRYYLPAAQSDDAAGLELVLRMGEEVESQMETVRSVLQKEMTGDGYLTGQPFADVVDGQRRSWRVGATMFTAFGGLALLIAAVGLYGVISYNVAQRMHELGVRSALGARGVDLIRLVASQGVRLAIVGIGAGLAVALVVARWVQPLLFNQSASDPVTYGAVAALLLVVAIAASAVPAARASRADPNSALRAD